MSKDYFYVSFKIPKKYTKILSALLFILSILFIIHIHKQEASVPLVTVYVRYEYVKEIKCFRFWVNQLFYNESLLLKHYSQTAIVPTTVYTNPFSFRLTKGNYSIGVYSPDAPLNGMGSFTVEDRNLTVNVTLQPFAI